MKKLLVLGLGAFAMILSGCGKSTPIIESEEPSSESIDDKEETPKSIKPEWVVDQVLQQAVMLGSYEIQLVIHGEVDTYFFFGVKYTDEQHYISYMTESNSLTEWNLHYKYYGIYVDGEFSATHYETENPASYTGFDTATFNQILLDNAFINQENIMTNTGSSGEVTYKGVRTYKFVTVQDGVTTDTYIMPYLYNTGAVIRHVGNEEIADVDLLGFVLGENAHFIAYY